jgi:hypothetical protein
MSRIGGNVGFPTVSLSDAEPVLTRLRGEYMIESDTGYIEARKQDRENMKTNYNRREHTRGEHGTGIHVNQGNENRNT